MQRVLWRSWVVTTGMAVGLAGCDGGGGDVGAGMPKETTGYVPLSAPAGAPPVTADMSKSKKDAGKGSVSPAPAGNAAPQK